MSFDIKKIAYLARISITEDEVKKITPKLESIMLMIDELQKADTSKILPLSNPLQRHQRLREDKITETDHHKIYQKLASNASADLYLVPQVIE